MPLFKLLPLSNADVMHTRKFQALLSTTERRVLRIRKTIETYGALRDRANLPRDVFERVVDDFDSIKAELVDVHAKIASGSKFKKWFSSPAFCRIAVNHSGSSAPTGASSGHVWSHVVQGE